MMNTQHEFRMTMSNKWQIISITSYYFLCSQQSSPAYLLCLQITYSKTSLILTSWEQHPWPNNISAAENIFREVIKWTPHVFLGNTTLFSNLDSIS
jgi:hypothetical protein